MIIVNSLLNLTWNPTQLKESDNEKRNKNNKKMEMQKRKMLRYQRNTLKNIINTD